jgi:hypothetical protein
VETCLIPKELSYHMMMVPPFENHFLQARMFIISLDSFLYSITIAEHTYKILGALL